jgi:hypothetical protein
MWFKLTLFITLFFYCNNMMRNELLWILFHSNLRDNYFYFISRYCVRLDIKLCDVFWWFSIVWFAAIGIDSWRKLTLAVRWYVCNYTFTMHRIYRTILALELHFVTIVAYSSYSIETILYVLHSPMYHEHDRTCVPGSTVDSNGQRGSQSLPHDNL